MQRGIAENAICSKWAGGLGGSWTAVRGTGAHIGGTNGETQGVIPFLKLHNDQLVAVNQGGKRKGSGCAYLETWHNDIFEFLELRSNTGDDRRRTHDMNTANWIPDLFMKRMEAREHWTLFRCTEVPDLHELYGAAFEERYVAYEQLAAEGKIFGREDRGARALEEDALDALRDRPSVDHLQGPLQRPLPAGPRRRHPLVQSLHRDHAQHVEDETAVCNLGSIILDEHLTADGALDHEKLRETIRIAVRALDNVIDINFYPTEAARTLQHAPPPDRPRRHGPAVRALPQGDRVRLRRRRSSSTTRSWRRSPTTPTRPRATSPPSAAPIRRYKGSKWDRGLLPQDTLDLLERSAACRSRCRAAARMDWAPAAREDRRAGHAQLQRARDRADRDDLEHHGHLALHRADLQEPVRQIEPLRRVRRPQPVPRARPQGRAASGTGR